MSSDETDLIERLHAVAAGFSMPVVSAAEDMRRGRRRVRRNRGLVVGAAAAAVLVIVGVTAAVGGQDRAVGPQPAKPPGIVLGDVPVWYDAKGLHRGDVVEHTPVKIGKLDGDVLSGALALVRGGAVYLDPATRDVWFHPWGGEPHVVGHNSSVGPGGDPNGDTAAWFESSGAGFDPLEPGPGELVVYDTAAGRAISRSMEPEGPVSLSGDHNPPGNTFVQVSAERVVWTSARSTYVHDLRKRTTSVIDVAAPDYVLDVHDRVEVVREMAPGSSVVVLRTPGRAEQRYPGLEPRGRLSPSGNYLLSVEGTETVHAAAIVDIRTGDLWVPRNAYPWIAWSYGNVALVDVEDALLACDATRRMCETLPAERPFLMPTN